MTDTPPPTDPLSDTKGDEIVTLRLPRREAEEIRKMIRERMAMGEMARWGRNVALVAIGGLISLFVFGQQLVDFFKWLFRASPGG